MQPVMEGGSIDKPLTFDVGLIQLALYKSVHLIHATSHSNCAEGLHFSAFHYLFLLCGINFAMWALRIHIRSRLSHSGYNPNSIRINFGAV